MNEKKKSRNLGFNIFDKLKDEKYSYHSSISSKISEKDNNKNKRKSFFNDKNIIKNRTRKISENKDKKIDYIKNKKKRFKSSLNLYIKKNVNKNKLNENEDNEDKNKENKEIEKVKINEKLKKERFDINKGLLNEQKPIIVNELPKYNFGFHLGDKNKNFNDKNKVIKIFILHREEISFIEINNGLSVCELIEQILQNLKILKNESELFLIHQENDIKTNLNNNKNLNYLLKNILIKSFDKGNKIKTSNSELKNINEINKNKIDLNNNKNKILFYPDFNNKYKKMKIKDLLKNKRNYYIIANQVSKNKYISNNIYKKEIKNISINTFDNNINKEIEKNNKILSDNNIKAIDIDNNIICKEKNNNNNKDEIKNKYKYIVYVEGINSLSINDFFKEIDSFLNEHEIKDNYDCQNIGIGKYCFGFQRNDIAHDFNKFVSLLQLCNSKYFHIRHRLKIFNSKKKYKNNNSLDDNNNIQKKCNFFYYDKFSKYNYFALKNNLNGNSNSYFLIKGQKKFLTLDDTESMDEIVNENKFKFKIKNNSNYINSQDFSSIPLI